MRPSEGLRPKRNAEHGLTLLLVALGLVVLLGIAALAIDLVALYVVRNEAQRAADAAALAGARVFADSGCAGSGNCAAIVSQAIQEAMVVGNQNGVAGTPASVQSGDVTCDVSNPRNPRVTVAVQRTASRGNPAPTFFAKILGFGSADVTATATAEAYNPSGGSGNSIFCTTCVRPWVVANCDPSHPAPRNPLCGGSQAFFLDPNGNYAIANPGPAPGGIIGESLDLRLSSAPSQYGAIDFGGGTNGYQRFIRACQTLPFTCGNTLRTLPGGRGTPTVAAVRALIHASGPGLGRGQDTIDTTVYPPQIHAGYNNPLVVRGVIQQNEVISISDSVVTVFVYDGRRLRPGRRQRVTILGFMQVFITQVTSRGDVPAVILNLAGCGDNPQPNGTCDQNAGGSGVISGGGASLIPVRLVRNP